MADTKQRNITDKILDAIVYPFFQFFSDAPADEAYERTKETFDAYQNRPKSNFDGEGCFPITVPFAEIINLSNFTRGEWFVYCPDWEDKINVELQAELPSMKSSAIYLG